MSCHSVLGQGKFAKAGGLSSTPALHQKRRRISDSDTKPSNSPTVDSALVLDDKPQSSNGVPAHSWQPSWKPVNQLIVHNKNQSTPSASSISPSVDGPNPGDLSRQVDASRPDSNTIFPNQAELVVNQHNQREIYSRALPHLRAGVDTSTEGRNLAFYKMLGNIAGWLYPELTGNHSDSYDPGLTENHSDSYWPVAGGRGQELPDPGLTENHSDSYWPVAGGRGQELPDPGLTENHSDSYWPAAGGRGQEWPDPELTGNHSDSYWPEAQGRGQCPGLFWTENLGARPQSSR
jgi:hypothetical protein